MKKKKYEAPAMQVFELKAQQSLLAGSVTGTSIEKMKSQSWDWDDSSSFEDQ